MADPYKVVVTSPDSYKVVVTAPNQVKIVSLGIQGPPGAPGAMNVFISPTAPPTPPATYLWIQTGLGASGIDMTFWVEDGLP